MAKINLTIDGRPVQVEEGSTILRAAREIGINVPSLCNHPELKADGACRVCIVEVEGAKSFVASCVFPVNEGMVIKTNSPALREARKTLVEMILANHPQDCLICLRNNNCELQSLAAQLGVNRVRFYGERKDRVKDETTPSIVRDPEKCILCGRCVTMCVDVQGVGALDYAYRGFDVRVVPAFDLGLSDTACALCGQCTSVCPVGAIVERDDRDKVWQALNDPATHVVVQTAPAVRVALGEEFGFKDSPPLTQKMVAALRRLGFDRVFDTDFTADLTIMEEGHELLARIENNGILPMITSCSPGWIKFIEHFYPDLLGHLSTCKSPQQMFGALAKTYYPQTAGLNPADVFVVSIMPCTAKKFEAERPEMHSSGYQDVDAVLTTRELARMLREAGIDLASLEEEQYDAPLGISTGAGVIFGATGGVMEAALRTVHEVVTGDNLEQVEFEQVRGLEGIKEASVDLNGTVVKLAVAHGLGNAKQLMEKVQSGEADYHFIEIMCCPGGCIGGGGQPIPTYNLERMNRAQSLYQEDSQNLPWRKSHENPAVKQLYADFLGEPLGEKSHRLLHTHYNLRGKYPMFD